MSLDRLLALFIAGNVVFGLLTGVALVRAASPGTDDW